MYKKLKIEEKVKWSEYLKLLFALAFPVAMQNLLTTTASMVDTIMIGSRGQLAVGAVGICSQIGSLFFSSYWGFSCACMMFLSQYWGEKNEKGMSKTMGLSFVCMLGISLIFGSICVFRPDFILGIYTDKQNIIREAIPYMRIVGFAYPLQAMTVLLGNLLRATERVKPCLFTSIVSLLVNFSLNWVLIYGRFGMPKMGVAGAAVGTVVSSLVSVILILFFLKITKCEIKIQFREIYHFKGFFKNYVKKAFPILCNEVLYGIGQMIINVVMGHQDENAIAAMTAFRVCEGFVFAFFGGLSTASSVSIGKEVGSGHPFRALSFAKKAALACPIITFAIVGICCLINRPLLGLFHLEPQAMTYGKYMLLIYLVFGTIRTSNYIMNEGFRAGGESMFGALVETGFLFLISVPATWATGMIFKLPFLIVFGFVYTDEIMRFIVEVIYLFSGKWVKPVTDVGKEALPAYYDKMGIRPKTKKSRS